MSFCVKQKTAYEMRISDWSSDVCSSDLKRRDGSAGDHVVVAPEGGRRNHPADENGGREGQSDEDPDAGEKRRRIDRPLHLDPLGSAPCRARVCPYVFSSLVAVSFKTNKLPT